jgi:hypothetical protein
MSEEKLEKLKEYFLSFSVLYQKCLKKKKIWSQLGKHLVGSRYAG